MSDTGQPLDEHESTVTLPRADYEALLGELEDAEDRVAILEHRLSKAEGKGPEMLSLQEADLLIRGENPVRFWREKRGLTQQALSSLADISKSFLSEIETGKAEGRIETLRKLAHALKTDVDSLLP